MVYPPLSTTGLLNVLEYKRGNIRQSTRAHNANPRGDKHRGIVNGATPAKDFALASAGAELRLVNGVTLLAKFDGEFARGSQTYAGTGTLRYAW